MRLVADESCDFAVVSAVRSAGHDVISITERMPGAEDEQVIKLAAAERRLLLTEDKDFGQLVILIRYPSTARSTLTDEVVKLLAERMESLYSRFAVMEPGRVRVTQLVQ